MSRRRRQRSPLLGRIILISLAAHVVALPILAYYGAFDKMRKSFGTSTIVMLAPEKSHAKPPELAKKPKKAATQNVKRGANKGRAATVRKDLPQVAVQQGTGAIGGPTVEQGAAPGGTLPPGASGDKHVADTGPGTAATKPVAAPKPDVPIANVPPPKPVTEPPKPPAKHIPVYTVVEPTYQPEPTIPDDLRGEPLDKTAVVEVTVAADGSIARAALGQSCGIKELDDIALRTAKTWRFKPATADGEPVSGKARLHIEFKVE